MQTTALYRGHLVSCWAEFETRAGEWITVEIPFANVHPQIRGFKLKDGPGLDPGKLTEFGLYTDDNKDGPFELRRDSVTACAADAPQALLPAF